MTAQGTIAVLTTGAICAELAAWLHTQPKTIDLVHPRGYEIAAQRNWAVREMQGDWLLFVDSDCVPQADTLPRLLAYQRPLIGATVLDRRTLEVCATKTFEPTVRYGLKDVAPERGAIAVLALGTGCLLIRRAVLNAVREPWFTCGQLVSDCITEDTDFCLRAAEKGFAPYLACDVRVGHVARGVVWPSDDGVARVQWDGTAYAEPIEAYA